MSVLYQRMILNVIHQINPTVSFSVEETKMPTPGHPQMNGMLSRLPWTTPGTTQLPVEDYDCNNTLLVVLAWLQTC